MFWGLALETGKRYAKTVETPFRITQAVLDTTTADDDIVRVMVDVDDCETLLCNLSIKHGILQCPLDLQFLDGEQIALYSYGGKGQVYLSGYLISDEGEESMFGDEEEDIAEEEEVSSDEDVPDLVAPSTSGKRKPDSIANPIPVKKSKVHQDVEIVQPTKVTVCVDNPEATSLLKDDQVKAALLTDKGKDASLISWDTKPFVKKGDGFSAYITSIVVKYTMDNKAATVTYVAKINPCRKEPGFGPVQNSLFKKEGQFYMEILSDMNKELEKCGQNPVAYPKCFYTNMDMMKEVIIFEDLRAFDFKLTDRKKGMDLQHATLLVETLAGFHAASILLQQKLSSFNLKKKYNTLSKDIWVENKEIKDLWVTSGLLAGLEVVKTLKGYDRVKEMLENILKDVDNNFFNYNFKSSPPFDVIGHGDCWTNNALFKYDSDGNPVQAMFLDAEISCFGSLALDLSHFMAISLDGSTRKTYTDHLLTQYYKSFCELVNNCNGVIPFTLDELRQEFKAKRGYGQYWAISVLPLLLMSDEEMTDYGSGNTNEATTTVWHEATVANFQTNQYMKSRLLSIFDEMIES